MVTNPPLQSNNDAHLLVVDDDDRIRELLKQYLTAQGFRISLAANAAQARKLIAGLSFDLIILDVMMPGEDGLSLTRSLREMDMVPIILLTARAEPADRITGLKLGADDYLPKPFEPEELVLRIKAILKRAAIPPRTQRLRFGPYVFDKMRNLLTKNGQRIHLTTGETALLTTLSARLGAPISRALLAQNINAKSERAVDVQITRLRRKLETNPSNPDFITTVRNQGYQLQAEPLDD